MVMCRKLCRIAWFPRVLKAESMSAMDTARSETVSFTWLKEKQQNFLYKYLIVVLILLALTNATESVGDHRNQLTNHGTTHTKHRHVDIYNISIYVTRIHEAQMSQK